MSTAEAGIPAPAPPDRSTEQADRVPGGLTEPAERTGTQPDPGDESQPGTEEDEGKEEAGPAKQDPQGVVDPPDARRRWRRAVLPLVLAVLLAAGGVFLHLGAQLRGSADTADLALTDPAAAGRVAGDVGTALGKVLSYRPTDTEASTAAARELLDATAAEQYQALMDQLRQRVTEQKLTLTTRVVRTGVVHLGAERAQLLVFLDQVAQREGRPATVAGAQLSVSARLDGGHWRITGLTAR